MSDRDQIMGHGADNDGIEEYDNALPDWWLGMLFFTILFAVGYSLDYHWISERSQEKAYLAEMEAAAQRWPAPSGPATVAVTPELVAAGKAVFAANCVGCHGKEMQGGIGPNLVDGTWIHGGTLPEIQETITNGVPEKGMLTWGPILGPEKISQVAAYVYESSHRDGS